LDFWLNRQVGWRAFVLAWLLISPLTITMVSWTWDLFNSDIARLGLVFLEAVCWSLLAAVPLAGLFLLARRRPGKGIFQWRAQAGVLCMMAGSLLNLLTGQQGYSTNVQNATTFVGLLLVLAGLGFLLRGGRRLQRLKAAANTHPESRI